MRHSCWTENSRFILLHGKTSETFNCKVFNVKKKIVASEKYTQTIQQMATKYKIQNERAQLTRSFEFSFQNFNPFLCFHEKKMSERWRGQVNDIKKDRQMQTDTHTRREEWQFWALSKEWRAFDDTKSQVNSQNLLDSNALHAHSDQWGYIVFTTFW